MTDVKNLASQAQLTFPTSIEAIQNRIDNIDAIKYGRSRNFIDGDVTYLSPYFCHGAINTQQVLLQIAERYSSKQAEKFIFELAWRDFFQTVYRWYGQAIFHDLRFPQEPIRSYDIPQAIIDGNVGIRAIDDAVQILNTTGYMHNHARMWLASIVCNVANVHWYEPAMWLYANLLDGDLASNTLSWQWVAGAFASKKYYANQENLNKYSGIKQRGTFLDTAYSELPELKIPEVLLEAATDISFDVVLPESTVSSIEVDSDVLLYHMWMLAPTWQQEKKAAKRILVIEPSLLERFPMSQRRIDFVVALVENVEGLELYIGELTDLHGLDSATSITSIEHPALEHWKTLPNSTFETAQTMFQPVFKEYKSFFAYWKACQKTDAFSELFG